MSSYPEVPPAKVLDHGYVKYIDHMGSDETVISAARMSTGKGFLGWDAARICVKCTAPQALLQPLVDANGSDQHICSKEAREHQWADHPGDAKLLEFLYKNQHMSPFEQCELVVEVQAPIMVFREWHRHRTGQYNEFSARYAQMPNLHYVPELERFQKQSATNKQGSAEAIDPHVAALQRELLRHEQSSIYDHYEHLLSGENALAKEVARLNTPVSRYSKMRAKMNLRNWLGFLNLRLRPNAQWEIRQFAEAVASIVQKLFPRSYALFQEYDLNSVRLSASEVEALKQVFPIVNASEFDGDPRIAALEKKVLG